MKKAVLVLLALALAGCFEDRIVTHETVVGMEIVAVREGHKGYAIIDLKVIGTNSYYRDRSLGCSYSKLKYKAVGTKWDIVTQDFKQGDRYGTQLRGLNGICDYF